MMEPDIQELLSLVERPSRYLGNEINSIRKEFSRMRLKFVLAFPDLYEIGMSHFGIQILYHVLNAQKDIGAERVFAPPGDMEALLRQKRMKLFSLESHQPLAAFDIIGFSLMYELNYTNVLLMLDLSGIPFFSRDRGHDVPLIIGGGPCTANPEPISDIFDAFVIGDGEDVILEMSRRWIRLKNDGVRDKDVFLKEWSRMEAVYVPSQHPVYFDQYGCQRAERGGGGRERKAAGRAIVSRLEQAVFPEHPIVPFGKPVHDRLRLEIARGCTRGCRFCQAGMIYRPVRERSAKELIRIAREALRSTGYDDISLLSLSSGDYSCIEQLLSQLMQGFSPEHIAVSLPSLRAGTLTPEMMRLIKAVRKTGFTIAPEAGSQRLRNVINKNIQEEQIVESVKGAFDLGWQVVKLYFMCGLPTETEADCRAIVDLVRRLLALKGERGRTGRLNVSVATFIPKAHTPFQWAGQSALQVAAEKIDYVKQEIRSRRVHFKWQNPEVSWIEGLFARGDRRLNALLVAAYQEGCRFDGWSDTFQFQRWAAAFEKTGIDPDFYTTRERSLEEVLPWDHLDLKIDKEFLQKEWRKALQERATCDCRSGKCSRCGTCDFKTTAPQLMEKCGSQTACTAATEARKRPVARRLEVGYSKTGPARLFGHLEMVSIISRALRRADVPVAFSGGFHPLPRLSFANPLPLGMESREELFFIRLTEDVAPAEIKARLNRSLPGGIHVHSCRWESAGRRKMERTIETYTVSWQDAGDHRESLGAFSAAREWPIRRRKKKGGFRQVDLKAVVQRLEKTDGGNLRMTLNQSPGTTVRPADVLKSVFGLSENTIKKAAVMKEKTSDV